MRDSFSGRDHASPIQEHAAEQKRTENLMTCLRYHVSDQPPGWHGVERAQHLVAGSFVGAIDAQISRCDPPLQLGTKFSLEGGKSIVVTGPNGAGKSTLFDAIMHRGAHIDQGSYGYTEGIHEPNRLRISRLDQEELLGEIGDQPVEQVLTQVAAHYKQEFPVDWSDYESDGAYERNERNQAAETRIDTLINQVADLFDVHLFKDRLVRDLSGGERTKLSLLMVLASEPDVLLLDEPTNHLDLESIAKLTGLFDQYTRAGVSVVSVSHVEWFLDMVGKDGTIELTRDANARHATQSTSPHVKFKKHEARKPAMEGSITWRIPDRIKAGALFEIPPHLTIPNSPLNHVSVPAFQRNEIAILSGKNGVGKTRLMHALADRDSHLIRRERGVQTAYLPQIWPKEVAEGTIEQFFHWVKSQTNPHSQIEPSNFQKEVRALGFKSDRVNFLSQPFTAFSGGEQRLLWFAAASVLEGTDVLVLDEPSNHMDEPTMLKVVEAIQTFPGAVILSSHDVRLMMELEKDPGKLRMGTAGVSNITFERTPTGIKIERSKVSPHVYAEQIIANARKQAGRVNVRAK